MRKLFRLAVPVLAAAAIALGSGSTALAAASPTTLSLDANWCFDDVVMLYCFDVDGQARFLDNKAGSSVTVNETTRTTYYQNGVYVGASKSVEMFRGVFQNDGTDVLQSLIHTRSTVFGEDCEYHMVLRISNYEAVVDHVVSTCGA